MKKIEVRPEKVRGMGNLIPPLSVSDFELSDCMIHEEDPFKINGHLFNHFSIDVPVVPVNLVLSTDVATIYPDATTPNIAVITATLTDSSGAPVSNVDVYFQENNSRIGTASTNAQGICTLEYSSSIGGTHTIRAYTTKQARYNKSSAEINVNVYIPTSLTLSPASKTVNTVDVMSLTSKITDQTGLPVPDKLINLYYLDKVVKSARSDNRGVATFNVTYPELRSAKTNTVISITSDKTTYSVGDTAIITVTLKDDDGNPLSGKLITTNMHQEKTTNSEGKAVFNISYSSAVTISFNCSFAGDSNYNESAASISLEYIEAAPEINISADTLVGETGDTIQITVSATGIPPQAPLYLVEDGKETVTLDSKAYPDKMKYTCTGAGDVKLKVKCILGTNVYYSNILTVEDCLFYDTMTSESDRWVRTSDIIVDIDSEGTKFSTNSNSEQQYRLPSKYFTPPYTIEFDWVDGGGNQKMALELWPDTKYSGDTCWYGSHWDSGANKFIISTYPSSTSSSKTEADITRDINPNDHLKFIVEPNNVKLYQNGELILNKHQGKTCDTQYFCFYTNKNRIQKVKNLKIKHYSE